MKRQRNEEKENNGKKEWRRKGDEERKREEKGKRKREWRKRKKRILPGINLADRGNFILQSMILHCRGQIEEKSGKFFGHHSS